MKVTKIVKKSEVNSMSTIILYEGRQRYAGACGHHRFGEMRKIKNEFKIWNY